MLNAGARKDNWILTTALTIYHLVQMTCSKNLLAEGEVWRMHRVQSDRMIAYHKVSEQAYINARD